MAVDDQHDLRRLERTIKAAEGTPAAVTAGKDYGLRPAVATWGG